MIGEALNEEINRQVSAARGHNPLLTKAEDGSLGPRMIARYLANVHQLVKHTPIHLLRARDRAKDRGDLALARHFEHKLEEEAGHDQWAEKDREGLARRSGATATDAVVPAMSEMLAFIESLIDRDPTLYLAYILFAEQLVVLMGPEWLSLLETRCGIPRSVMTVVGNHAELDKDHVAEALDVIDALVGDPAKLPAMREALLGSIEHFQRFCVDVTSETTHVEPDQGSDKHIAAA
jgi:pyrroloquinoline quinone (PQQ) biosynthesis protein C